MSRIAWADVLGGILLAAVLSVLAFLMAGGAL